MNNCEKCGAKKKVLFTSWYCDCENTSKNSLSAIPPGTILPAQYGTTAPYVPLKNSTYPYGPYSSNYPLTTSEPDPECSSCGSSSCVCYTKTTLQALYLCTNCNMLSSANTCDRCGSFCTL